MSWVLVALGAAAGAMGRYAIDLMMQRWSNQFLHCGHNCVGDS